MDESLLWLRLKMLAGGARSVISYIEVGSCLDFGSPNLLSTTGSTGKREYDCFFACPRLAYAGSGFFKVFCSIALGNTLSLNRDVGDGLLKVGLAKESILMTLPFSSPTKPARLSARDGSSRAGVRGPETGDIN